MLRQKLTEAYGNTLPEEFQLHAQPYGERLHEGITITSTT